MNSIVHILIHPIYILWFWLLIGVTLYWKRKTKPAKYCFYIALFWFFIISVSPVPKWLAYHLESKFSTFELKQKLLMNPVHIIVLGAGHTNDPSLSGVDKLYPGALARLAEGIRIHKLIPGSKLVCSGFGGKSDISQAEIYALAAMELGVLPADTLLIPEPHNTKSEAKFYTERFKQDYTLILVTDAIHMPRAMMWFKKFGLNPIPAPTNHCIKIDPEQSEFAFKISAQKLILMEKSLHEYVGMLAR